MIDAFNSWQTYKLKGSDLNSMVNRIIREIESAKEVLDLKLANKDNEIKLLKEQIEILKNSKEIEYKEKIVYRKR